jgi:O-acetyl-ADP-ribose deacetylase (regulator of RNase III)
VTYGLPGLNYLKGDATAPVGSGHRIICHVCNDIGGWGRGFVMALSKRWKEPEAQYRTWHEQGEAQGFRLGAIQLVRVTPDLEVANMVAQRDIRPIRGVPPIRYDALKECLSALAAYASKNAASVHMPRIGCGLAGGTWSDVEAIVQSSLVAAGVPVYVYDL